MPTNSVTFPAELGGDGKTYTDDAHPDTGLDGLGYTTRFIPCQKQTVAMAVSAKNNADAAEAFTAQCQTLRNNTEHYAKAAEVAANNVPRSFSSSAIADPALPGVAQDVRLFDMSAREEMAYQLSAQNSESELPQLTGTVLGECYFGLPTMDQTFKVVSPFPRINAEGRKVANANFGGSQTIALSDIRAATFNSSLNLPLFEVAGVDQYGITAFRYVGKQPLHTVIRGGIQWLQRIFTGSISATAATDAWIRLSPLPLGDQPASGMEEREGMPAWEAGGQARGRQYLGFCAASGAQHFQLIEKEWNDQLGRISPEVESAIAENPELNTEPYENAWLSAGEEESLDPDDAGANIPDQDQQANLKTSAWIPVTGGLWYRGAVMPSEAGSSRGRAQWRDADGNITAINLGSGNFLYQMPEAAVEFRIYYAGPQDSDVTGLSIKTVAQSQINSQIVTRGTWRRYNINVCRDVVFYPNTVYRLEMKIFGSHRIDGNGVGYWFEYDDGYRIESGGLSFMFDASALIKERAKIHDNRGTE
ncbi:MULTISPECIES: hypothetical protein [unclassified Halomonas]|uniref:hypothetical protein n=1 Tax=unclassified Halomonas TaxID=2609666 RepID=UPI0009909447|nr:MULTISPECIES: hypothetical protein [unclassified Halomonas]AQU83256.1 hypothetical protein B2G49_12175 [Halomonas sp. 'Soap Lake \